MKLERLKALFYYKDGFLYNRISRGSAKKDTLAGYIAEDGYARVRVDGASYYIHGDRLNNDIDNLRLATSLENQYNKFRQKNGTSQYKGVWFDSARNCWKASIRFKDKRHYIGQFSTELEAALAYDKLAAEIQGRFFKPNI